MYILLLLLSIVLLVSGEYFLLLDEKRECMVNLMNSTTLFDGLIPCGLYDNENIELTCLNADQSLEALARLNEWNPSGNDSDLWSIENTSTGPALKRNFTFDNFREAFYFMSKAAQLAEKNQHHPQMSNFYNIVDVTLNTDDKQCLSTFDVELAKGLNIAFKSIAR